MSKIIVPQELQDQIVDLYVNKGYGRPQIKKELNLPFGDSVILRILKEHDIEIRTNNGAKKGRRKKMDVDVQLQQKIIEKYQEGHGLDKIVEELNLPFGSDKVRSILQDNGIKIRNVQESAKVKEMPDLRKYSINDDYCIESHNGAWLLGFIAADGYLPIGNGSNNRITISLAEKDVDILEAIKKELNYTGPITHYESNGYPAVSLSFTSKNIRQNIEKYGIGNNKTFKLHHLPNLPKEYMIDFISGFFDGDGSIYESKDHHVRMGIVCASRNFLKEISDFLNKEYGTSIPKIYETVRVHTIYNITYYKGDTFLLGELFYNNDYLALPRKKNYFLELKKKYHYE